jgi:hypothetical protein
LEKENAVEDWKEWIGPSDPISARKINPGWYSYTEIKEYYVFI